MNKETWEKMHQPYELNYWINDGLKNCANEPLFYQVWNSIIDWIGITQFGIILDIGCGPRPPLQKFGLGVYCIDPLIDAYKKITPSKWWAGIECFSQPAETFISEFVDKFDFILCWNALDHTYNWEAILENVHKYLKDDGIFALATDLKEPNIHLGHPSFPKDDFIKKLNDLFEIKKQRSDNFTSREICYVLTKKAK